jgi:tetratricopeptide (TPR) repeat protein
LLVLLGVVGLTIACWRRSPVTSFGLAWVILTLLPASNFIVPAGFIIAERTLLLPSVGAMIAVGSVVAWIIARIEGRATLRIAGAALVVLVLGLGIGRSVSRNRAWRDNGTLFRQGIIDAPDSYRSHFMLGGYLFETGRKAEGEVHYRHAIDLFPYDPLMLYAFAEQYRLAGMCAAAIPYYNAVLELAPDQYRGHNGLAACLLMTGKVEDARRRALAGIRVGANVPRAREILGLANRARDSARSLR